MTTPNTNPAEGEVKRCPSCNASENVCQPNRFLCGTIAWKERVSHGFSCLERQLSQSRATEDRLRKELEAVKKERDAWKQSGMKAGQSLRPHTERGNLVEAAQDVSDQLRFAESQLETLVDALNAERRAAKVARAEVERVRGENKDLKETLHEALFSKSSGWGYIAEGARHALNVSRAKRLLGIDAPQPEQKGEG